MKYSRQKEEILKLMRSGSLDHPKAAAVFVAMKEILPDIGIATVYRNLNALVDAGMIRRIGVAGDADRFDHRLDEHNHAICESCGAVFDFEGGAASVAGELYKNFGFRTVSQSLSVRGVCRACAESESRRG